jgi:hypothetical protein
MNQLQLQYELIVAFILLALGFFFGFLVSRLTIIITNKKRKVFDLIVPPVGALLIYLIFANNVIWKLIDLIGNFFDKLMLVMVFNELNPLNILVIIIGASLGGILNRKII